MIARFRSKLPFRMFLVQGSSLPPVTVDRAGFSFEISPPYQTASYGEDPDVSFLPDAAELASLLEPAAEPKLSEFARNGKPLFRADAIQIFVTGAAVRRPEDGVSRDNVAPSLELCTAVANELLEYARVARGVPLLGRLTGNEPRILEFLTDDRQLMPVEKGFFRRYGDRHSVLRTSLAATAAPLRLQHAAPAAQLSVRSVRPTNQHLRRDTLSMKLRTPARSAQPMGSRASPSPATR